MSKREPEFYLIDIFVASNKIFRYVKEIANADKLRWNELVWDGVIRELEIVGEATNNLLKFNLVDKKYRIIVDFRNIIVHGYFGIDEEEVWAIIKDNLPMFLKELKELVKNKNIDVNEVINYAIIENKKLDDVVSFLNNLQEELSNN